MSAHQSPCPRLLILYYLNPRLQSAVQLPAPPQCKVNQQATVEFTVPRPNCSFFYKVLIVCLHPSLFRTLQQIIAECYVSRVLYPCPHPPLIRSILHPPPHPLNGCGSVSVCGLCRRLHISDNNDNKKVSFTLRHN